MTKKLGAILALVILLLAVALLLMADSIGIGTIAYFADTETVTANVTMAGTWESVGLVGAEGDGEWNSPSWQVIVYPGERKETTITFANSYVKDIATTLVLSIGPDDDGNLLFGLDSPTLLIPAQGEASVLLWVEASQSTAPGVYSASLEIERQP